MIRRHPARRYIRNRTAAQSRNKRRRTISRKVPREFRNDNIFIVTGDSANYCSARSLRPKFLRFFDRRTSAEIKYRLPLSHGRSTNFLGLSARVFNRRGTGSRLVHRLLSISSRDRGRFRSRAHDIYPRTYHENTSGRGYEIYGPRQLTTFRSVLRPGSVSIITTYVVVSTLFTISPR